MPFTSINKHRSTNAFCILSGTARDLGAIASHYGNGLVAVAQNPKLSEHSDLRRYTIRHWDALTLEDQVIEVCFDGSIHIIEQHQVADLAR